MELVSLHFPKVGFGFGKKQSHFSPHRFCKPVTSDRTATPRPIHQPGTVASLLLAMDGQCRRVVVEDRGYAWVGGKPRWVGNGGVVETVTCKTCLRGRRCSWIGPRPAWDRVYHFACGAELEAFKKGTPLVPETRELRGGGCIVEIRAVGDIAWGRVLDKVCAGEKWVGARANGVVYKPFEFVPQGVQEFEVVRLR